MALLTSVSAGPRIQGAIKLVRLLEMPERDFEKQIREIEATKPFQLLREAGVVLIHPYPKAMFGARNLAGRELRASSGELGPLLDGGSGLARLIERIGRERFEQVFLRDSPLPDQEASRLCGITPEQAGKIRELINSLYVQAEFEGTQGSEVPIPTYSAVAGIEIENGRPVIAFFHRDIWKGRYEIDRDRWAQLAAALPPGQARNAKRLLSKLELIERRKTTLYSTLEQVVNTQAEYLLTGEPSRRAPLTQKRVAMRLEISPCALHHLVSRKSIRLPWGLEAPLKALMPSAKSLLLDRLHDLAMDHPNMPDVELGLELRRLFDARLSRRSIAQYRKDLGLGGRGCRVSA